MPASSAHERELALFALALEQPPTNRQAFLQAVCGKDNDLLERLEALLAGHEQRDDLLSPDGGLPKAPLKRGLGEAPDEAVGQTLGRYKLLERVGEGGCGVVYVAEQSEPVRRRVALKVIKLGMDTRQVVARFEAERQALAMMDHPNIAKVFDAGSTDTGRPFFVMELVRGTRITDYCDQAQLTTRERIDLFIQVCQAIQHAHQKGIIHRDIKPSNILVTLHDGVPVPKVIDFGIAKATEGRLTDKTVYTQLHQFIGTPAYMSPEQAEMSGLDIDTRSDIYSLGVLLYELLAGSPPFDPKELMEAGLDAMRKIIREKEPARPSTRLGTLTREELTTTAKRRSTEAPKLVHGLQGDLDWIVMKCLEKDRQRRYETASGLAADLNRHLSDEPVVARPPSAFYKTQKFIRRNKLVFAAGVAITTILVLGIAVSLWQAARANRAAQRALKAEAAAQERLSELEAVSSFMTNVFASPDPARNGRTITVAETLDRAVTNLDRDFAIQPAIRAELQATLAKTYYGLGLSREAIPLLEKVRDYRLKTFGLEDTNTLNAMNNLAVCYDIVGRADDALKLQTNVLAICGRLLGNTDPITIFSMHGLAISYEIAGRKDEALKLREEVYSLWSKIKGLEYSETISAMNNLGNSYLECDRKDEALRLREKILPLSRKVNGPEHPETLTAMNNLAISYREVGRLGESVELQERALPLRRKVNGPEHHDTIMAIHSLANTYASAGREVEELKLLEDFLPISRKVNGPEAPDTITTMNNLANCYFDVGRREEALKLREDTLRVSRKVLQPEDSQTIGAMINLAVSYFDVDRMDEALRLREEVLSLSYKVNGPENRNTIAAMGDLAMSYSATGRNDDSYKMRNDILALVRKVNGPEHPTTIQAMRSLAFSCDKLGRENEAIMLRTEMLTVRQKVLGHSHPETIESMNELAWDLATSAEESLRNGRKAVELAEASVSATSRTNAGILDTLAAAYAETDQFYKAVAAEREAIELLKTETEKKECLSHLDLFLAQKPFHQSKKP